MGRRLLTGIGIGAVVAAMSLVGVEASSAATVAPRQVAYIIDPYGQALDALDLATGTVLTVPTQTVLADGVAIAPDGARAYVTENARNLLVCVDTSTNQPCAAGPTTVGAGPIFVAVSPDGTRVYTTNTTDNTVSVVDASTMTLMATVPVGTNPRAFAVSPDGKHVYVVDHSSNAVSVIDTATNTVTATVAIDTPVAVAVTPDSSHVYVAGAAGSVSVIDTATNTVTATIPVGAQPTSVLVTKDGRRTFVAYNSTTPTKTATVSIIDTATNAVTAAVILPHGAYAMANSTDGSHIYATARNWSEVDALDAVTGAVTGSFTAPAANGLIAVGTVVPGAGPVAHFALTAYSDTGLARVDASASSHGWMTITSYTFDFGDGTIVTQSNPVAEHTYVHGGTYTIKVTVTDPASFSGTTSTETTVYPFVRDIALLSHSNDLYVTAEDAGNQPFVATRKAIGNWELMDVLDAGQGKVMLRSNANGMLVGVNTSYGDQLVANKSTPDTSTLFTIVQNPDGSLSLLSAASGRYVSSNNAEALMAADRSAIGSWEEFNQVLPYNASMSLRANANNLYVTAEGAGALSLIANRPAVGQWETFDVVDAGDGYIALFSHADGLFVTAEGAGTQALVANRAAIGSWEKFKIINNPDGSISLLSNVNGMYVTAEGAGALPLIANRTAIGSWEKFYRPFIVVS